MRFGLFIPQGWRFDLVGIDPAKQWSVMSDLVWRVDQGDAWESVWVYDHFHTSPRPSHEATHESWTLMAAFAAVTSRVRLGQMCTCMSYRNPAHLAKMAATVDVVSGGRVEMGIGGGWYEHEWRAYGYGFPSAGERLGRLREGVEILRQLWTTGEASLDGSHYHVDGAICAPVPLQTTSPRNRIPIWVAGGGEKKTLRIAAEYADYTNFDGTPGVFEAKSAVLARHCQDIGRDFAEITRTADFNPVIGETQRDVEDRLAWYESHVRATGADDTQARDAVESLRGQPLVGTVEQVVQRLESLRESGLAYAITYFIDLPYDTRSLELFENQVIPRLAG